mmetsp:Transcript_9124/g.17161  ORF Transcript_9124/g.17161 Transcript_9124/m.17161 type:complete len:232 (+) Transcript_9124:841-1536(+)
MVSHLLCSFSTRAKRSFNSSVTRWTSSRNRRNSARNPSRWISISCRRSSMLIFNWNFRFSKLKTSSACAARISRNLFTSRANTSCSTRFFSLASIWPFTCRDTISFSSFKVANDSSIRPRSVRSAVLRRRAFNKSSSACLTCWSSVPCSALTPSRIAVNFSIRAFKARVSSSLRTPFARLTFRSICCTWNSTLYSSSCCRMTCSSNERIREDRFRSCPCPPEISEISPRSF